MSLQTTVYIRRPFLVDAVLVDEENMEEVAAWCGGELLQDGRGKYIKVTVPRALNDYQTQARIGHWVLSHDGGSFKVYTEKAFKATFALLTNDTVSV